MRLETKLHFGVQILERWEHSRLPFVLYLRDFRVSLFHGGGFLLENHLWATLSLHSIGVLTLLNQGADHTPGSRGHGAPALKVPDDQWKNVVSDLIGKATMIVAEVPILSDGSRFELTTCIERGRALATIVIIPAPDGPFQARDEDPVIAEFPRVIYVDEIPALNAVDHFVFRDLVEQARKIAALEPETRKQLVDSKKTLAKFPMDFAAVQRGYQQSAENYVAQEQPQRASRSLFRALVVAGALEDVAAQAVLAESIASLCLDSGDHGSARNYLSGAIRLAQRAADHDREQRLIQRLAELDAALGPQRDG